MLTVCLPYCAHHVRIVLTMCLLCSPCAYCVLTMPLPRVQDFVPNDLEMRLYLVRGEVKHTVYSDFDVDNW